MFRRVILASLAGTLALSRAKSMLRCTVIGGASIAFLFAFGLTPTIAQPKKPPPPKPFSHLMPLEVRENFDDHLRVVQSLLRRPCIDAAYKKLVLNNTQAEIVWLRKYAKSWGTRAAEAEANADADSLYLLYQKLEKMAVCTPPGAVIGSDAPCDTQQESTDKAYKEALLIAGLKGELIDKQSVVRRLLDERKSAQEKRDDAKNKLNFIAKVKSGQMTREDAGLPPDYDLSAGEADEKQNLHEAQMDLDRIEGENGELKRAQDDEMRLRVRLKELGVETTNVTIGMCPAQGAYLGLELVKNSARVKTIETLAATGEPTNTFIDSGDPLGVGIVLGYNFAPWRNNVLVGPFVSFDVLNQTINHTFAGGTFLGTTTHWIINAGAKGGVVVTPGLYLYGLAGAAWLNHDLNVNFATAASRNTTTPGFTLGVGAEYQPSSWRLFGKPVSLFVQYQHTWYSTANFNMPASSPGFNYAFKREDDTIKLGVNIYLSR